MDNYLTTLDDNGRQMINPDYYKNIIYDYINLYIQDNEIKKRDIDGNDLLSIFRSVNEKIFINHNKNPNNPASPNSNIPYTTYNIATLYKLYTDISLCYKVHPSLYAFYVLTGIEEDTTKKYLTRAGVDTLNLRREMLRNELAQDKTGRIVLANNDQSYGLEYEKKSALDRETIKQGLSLQDLPKITG